MISMVYELFKLNSQNLYYSLLSNILNCYFPQHIQTLLICKFSHLGTHSRILLTITTLRYMTLYMLNSFGFVETN